MADIFISYDREDSDFAELLQLRLEKAGHQAKMDTQIINAGDDWRDRLDQTLRHCQALILIMTPDSKASEYVSYEWAFALGAGIRVIPLLLRESIMHPRLEPLQHIDFRNQERPWHVLLSEIDKVLIEHPQTTIPINANASPVIKKCVENLDSLDSKMQLEAVHTLLQIDDPLAKQILRQALQHPVKNIRLTVATEYPDPSDPAIIPGLIEAYRETLTTYDNNDKLRRLYWRLENFGKQINDFMLNLLDDKNTAMRSLAISVFSKTADALVVPKLISRLNDEKSWIRRDTAQLLGNLGDKDAIPHLRKTTQNDIDEVRVSAIIALANLDDQDSSQLFMQYLDDEPGEVRAAAAKALGILKVNAATPRLIEHLNNEKSQTVQSAVAKALGQIGDRCAIEPLRNAFGKSDIGNVTGQDIALALLQLRDLDSIPVLTKALIDFRSGTRPGSVVLAMADLGEQAIESLAQILSNDRFIAEDAKLALEKIGTEAALREIKRWRQQH